MSFWRESEAASPHSLRQLGSTHLRTASSPLFAAGTSSSGLRPCSPRQPSSRASTQHRPGRRERPALCSRSVSLPPQARQGWGRRSTQRQPPSPAGSTPAPWGAGDGAGGQASSAAVDKGPLFPPAFPGVAGAAQPGPGSDGQPSPALTPPPRPVLRQRGRKPWQPRQGQLTPPWPAAGSAPGHQGGTATSPRVPRALLLPPQPSPGLGMSIRGGRHCWPQGTAACQALSFLLQCQRAPASAAGRSLASSVTRSNILQLGATVPEKLSTSCTPLHCHTLLCHQLAATTATRTPQVLPRPPPSLLRCRTEGPDILRAINVCSLLVPQHQQLPQHLREPDSRETPGTSTSPGAPSTLATAATPNGTRRDAAPPATCPRPQQPPGLTAFLLAGEAERLCPASPGKAASTGACEVSRQRDNTLYLGTSSLWGTGAA